MGRLPVLSSLTLGRCTKTEDAHLVDSRQQLRNYLKPPARWSFSVGKGLIGMQSGYALNEFLGIS